MQQAQKKGFGQEEKHCSTTPAYLMVDFLESLAFLGILLADYQGSM